MSAMTTSKKITTRRAMAESGALSLLSCGSGYSMGSYIHLG